MFQLPFHIHQPFIIVVMLVALALPLMFVWANDGFLRFFERLCNLLIRICGRDGISKGAWVPRRIFFWASGLLLLAALFFAAVGVGWIRNG